MKVEVSVAEAMELIKEIRHEPESLFEMIRDNIKQGVGEYLSALMDMELTNFLGRGRGGSRQGRGGGFAAGPSAYCVCPNCGERAPHQMGSPCYEQKCPKCGTAMTRE